MKENTTIDRKLSSSNDDSVAAETGNGSVLPANYVPDEVPGNASEQKILKTDSSHEVVRNDSIEDDTSGNDSVDELSRNDLLDRKSVNNELDGNVSPDSGIESSFPTVDLELPSTVTDRKEIFMPLDIKSDDPRIYGKWMLFTNGDLYFQDYMWIHLQSLLRSGDVILLESSTVKKCRSRGRYQGVIKCYTCENKEAIKRAGIAIQSLLKDDIILHYKTNQASKDSLNRSYGDRFITKYMLTKNGKFYEKDELDRWKQVKHINVDYSHEEKSCATEEKSAKNRIPHVYLPPHKRRQSLGDESLPSLENSNRRYFHPSYKSLLEFGGFWSLFCNVTDFDDIGMTELDRTWMEIKNLCDEGVFSCTTCETYAFLPANGENHLRRSINCALEDYLNLDKVVQSGDKLRERVSYDLPMYFKFCYLGEERKMKYKLKYLYMDDRNLYEYVDEQWKLVKKSD